MTFKEVCDLIACVKQNLPEPEWRMQQGFVIVTFKRPPYGAEPGTCTLSTRQVSNKYRTSTEQVRMLVFNFRNDQSSLKEMMDGVGLKHRATFLKNYLYPAIDEGYIELLYPNQPNHPRQKYRLTEKALKWKRGE